MQGDRDYVTTGNTERGVAINPVTQNVLLVGRAGSPQVYVLSGADGSDGSAELGLPRTLSQNDADGNPAVAGGFFTLNLAAVGADGAVYACDLALDITTSPFKVYRWGNDDPATPVAVAFEGDPTGGQGGSGQDLRFGDNFAARGAGLDTQLAAASRNGKYLTIFTTTDGTNFTAQTLTTDASGKGGIGLAFGETNTVWSKINGQPLVQLAFGLAAGTATTIRTVPTTVIGSGVTGIAYDPATKRFAAVDYSAHTLSVFDFSDPDAPTRIGDTLPFPAANANGNGTAAAGLAGDNVAGLDTNNGWLAAKVKVSVVVEPPTIDTQPASVTVLEGGSVQFGVVAQGTKPLSYQWQLGGSPLTDETNATLSLSSVQTSQAGDYAVTIQNGALGILPPDVQSHCWWNLPSSRHNRGGVLSFADGHAELWRWVDPYVVQASETIKASYLASPGNYSVQVSSTANDRDLRRVREPCRARSRERLHFNRVRGPPTRQAVWPACESKTRAAAAVQTLTMKPRDLAPWLFAASLLVLPLRAADLWALAQSAKTVHRFSTLFTAQDVKNQLSTEAGLDRALDWCRKTAVTHVYLEVFRDGYQAERAALQHAKQRFSEAGCVVSGCVTTTGLGKKSNGWNVISCYTDPPTQEHLQRIFEYAASLFDETMIDDFWFTDCTCPECDAARKARTVRIGEKTFPVVGDTWEDYRCELMVRLSRERILAAGRRVNPKATFIVKYPQWYDRFHERGYEVLRETADFDRIWVGTETRDYSDPRWGGTVQYEAYFIMRWLGGIGGAKCGGGWFDPYGTSPKTYVEQARQTVLGGARESLLFCYGSLQNQAGPGNVEALRANIPELLAVAKELKARVPVGIAAYRPANSHAEKEARVFDFVGMLGVPLVPCHEFPTEAQAAFFSVHALKDPAFRGRFTAFVQAGKPVLITDGLAAKLDGLDALKAPNVQVLAVKGDPKSLLALSSAEVNALRAPLLKPFGTNFQAPAKVGLYLFTDAGWVVENFTDEPVQAELNGRKLDVPARGWIYQWR